MQYELDVWTAFTMETDKIVLLSLPYTSVEKKLQDFICGGKSTFNKPYAIRIGDVDVIKEK